MPTTVEDIRAWIRAAPKDTCYLIVVVDQFDWSDYPVYFNPTADENLRSFIARRSAEPMTSIMEVYDLKFGDPIEWYTDHSRVWQVS